MNFTYYRANMETMQMMKKKAAMGWRSEAACRRRQEQWSGRKQASRSSNTVSRRAVVFIVIHNLEFSISTDSIKVVARATYDSWHRASKPWMPKPSSLASPP